MALTDETKFLLFIFKDAITKCVDIATKNHNQSQSMNTWTGISINSGDFP